MLYSNSNETETLDLYSIVRPTMLYSSECWEVDKKLEQKISVEEMRMLRWMNSMMREDRIRKEYVLENIGVPSIVIEMRKNGPRWFWACYEEMAI